MARSIDGDDVVGVLSELVDPLVGSLETEMVVEGHRRPPQDDGEDQQGQPARTVEREQEETENHRNQEQTS